MAYINLCKIAGTLNTLSLGEDLIYNSRRGWCFCFTNHTSYKVPAIRNLNQHQSIQSCWYALHVALLHTNVENQFKSVLIKFRSYGA
jgi:hypothetical protein